MLPFVGGVGDEWNIPEFQDSPDPEVYGAHYGRRAAAAFAIQKGHLGSIDGTALASILANEAFQSDLRDRDSNGHAAAIHFVRQLERYLWALGQLVSPAQLAADAEAYIKESVSIHASWDAEERNRTGDDAETPAAEAEAATAPEIPTYPDEAVGIESVGSGHTWAAVMLDEAMSPTLKKGDAAVFVDGKPENGDVVLAWVQVFRPGEERDLGCGQESMVVRRYFKRKDTGKVHLCALNPAFEDIREHETEHYGVEVVIAGVHQPKRKAEFVIIAKPAA